MTKEQARHRLNYAVRMGRVIKPLMCACGNPRVEGHHEDYDNPLKVEWACSRCHKAKHPELYAPTHCPMGHPYSVENTVVFIQDGYKKRRCHACHLASCQKSNAALKSHAI